MCNVTQPALNKGVQKLEQELGGQLIYLERQRSMMALGMSAKASAAVDGGRSTGCFPASDPQ
jgi:DNA-binding transcriptional LysR family regulator